MAKAFPQSNNALVRHNKQLLFVTMWLAILELSTGHMEYINAGHNPPLLHLPEADKPVWLEKVSGPVLGIMPNCDYPIYQTDLPVGSKLLLYTDGFNEAENTLGEFYGNDRLEEAFLMAESPEAILQSVYKFTKDAEQSDDMTYLWLYREEGTKCR